MTDKLFKKVLIANRGEIAVRVIKTLRKLGIKSVAVYSEADINSLHVDMADEAYFIGNSPATDSYLSIPHILSAIRESGAQAVHPGYGFLSENPLFAQALQNEGIELIGPSAENIRVMGDKIQAKKIAEKAGVSTVPGYLGEIEDDKKAKKIAKKIGYPVIVKAAAGGGGRGMRVVRSEEDIVDAFASATLEAKNSFNDPRVFVEKFIVNPRHIEIQVLADKHGNAVCIGERECSIQRHHQKIIEEAPSPVLTEKTRNLMYKQVHKLVKEIKYFSAGTVEFIMDTKQNFYFMEMNTRLQVEHCVTEEVFGLDLVEQMIRVAAGQKLQIKQEDIKPNGWAIEARICAEDPSRGFLPSSGRITTYEEPLRNKNVRVDSGITEGGIVSMFYDQMISKLIIHAPTREEAIEQMKKSLAEYVIKGISHNIRFLEAIMDNQKFVDGDMSTNFIAQEYPDGFLGAELTSDITMVLLAASVFIHMEEAIRNAGITDSDPDQIRKVGTRWVVSIDGEQYPVIIKPVFTEFNKGYNIRFESTRIQVRTNWTIGNNIFRGKVNGKSIRVGINKIREGYYLTHLARKVKVLVRSPRVAELEQFMPEKDYSDLQTNLTANLSGVITVIHVKEGDEVKAGQKLLAVEAMKMENVVTAAADAVIEKIHVSAGDQVATGEALIDFKE
ncbi:MAG: acetyl/propionyl/methylcrotonyl-CoA carboxylase subunit alpha [Rickettsiales bacterium]